MTGEIADFSIESSNARAQIDFESSKSQYVVGCWLRPRTAQQRLNPREQLARLKWLGQIVIRPELQAHDAIHRLATCGKHQQRQMSVARLATQLTAKVQTVAVGQHQI